MVTRFDDRITDRRTGGNYRLTSLAKTPNTLLYIIFLFNRSLDCLTKLFCAHYKEDFFETAKKSDNIWTNLNSEGGLVGAKIEMWKGW